MGSDAKPMPLPIARLIGVGLVVFLANAAMLVLELVAGRLLAPFIGSSLETWTSVIGVFLAGIALGNGFGGKLADRYPTPRTLALLLALGAIAAVWMAIFPILISSSGVYKSLSLGTRIPMLTVILCLPAGLILSLLTPLAIKLVLPDVSKTGRVAGMVFALSTLGCLLGNYATGFILIPSFTINTLVFVSAGSLALLGLASLVLLGNQSIISASSETPQVPSETFPAQTINQGPVQSSLGQFETAPAQTNSQETGQSPPEHSTPANGPPTVSYAFSDIRLAFTIVFLASFVGMTLEMTASRILAQIIGVSLFTWTGIIGVMLAGTALGNLTGGWLADRVNRTGSNVNPRYFLAGTVLLGGAAIVLQFVTKDMVFRFGGFSNYDPLLQVMGWTFSLFFLPMYILGMVSPQVIRLAVPDVAHVGQVAGRVYAWSTAGAIIGTFASGYVLLSAIGMQMTILLIALILALTSLLVARVWNCTPLLYIFSTVLGGILGGMILNSRNYTHDDDFVAELETNYYTIRVTKSLNDDNERIWTLRLDHLIHSSINPDDPFYLYYKHEHVQMEFLRAAREENPNPRVLVVGGGGYTFPRYAMEVMKETRMDVVEIDPGVTWMAKNHLKLKDYDGLAIYHMDGRQYISEKVPPGTYDLVVQDAVNDLSVPSHLLTKEYNDAVKLALKPNGVYLLTVIDSIGYGKLWKAAFQTLQLTYPPEYIAILTADATDSVRFNFSEDVLGYLLRQQIVPEPVLKKLFPLRNKMFTRDDFVAELADYLEPHELQLYENGILAALDPNRYQITDEVLSTLVSLAVPQSVLTKLNSLKNVRHTRDSLAAKLSDTLDVNEAKQFKTLILDHARDLSARQVYVIYASDRPLDLGALRTALSRQVIPGFSAAQPVLGLGAGLRALGGMPHAWVATSLEPAYGKEQLGVLFRTHRIPQVDLQPYLDTPPRIILTDQYAPVDNLMADVFRYRDSERGRAK